MLAIPVASFAGALLVLLTRQRVYGLIASVISLAIAVVMTVSPMSGLQIALPFTMFPDAVGLTMLLLSAALGPFSLVCCWGSDSRHHALILVLLGLVLAVFAADDLIAFYVLFEAVLIPLVLLIGGYGAHARVRAAYLLYMYTLVGSLAMLVAVAWMARNVGVTFEVLESVPIASQRWLWVAFLISFAGKTPLVPFHVWLYRAHAEAPLSGSVLLAGVILKLATYGYARVMLGVLPAASSYYEPLVQALGLITLVYASLSVLRQFDMKAAIATSSVGHMALVVLGLFSGSATGMDGAILLALGHGFVSPGLFVVCGGVLYDRFHTRTIRYLRGAVVLMPVTAAFLFGLSAANMAVPLTVSWTAELLVLTGTFAASRTAGIVACSSVVLAACYSGWLYTRLAYGEYSKFANPVLDASRREETILAVALGMAVVLGLSPVMIYG